ncbi:MAG: cardiolipin synthase [Lachnospiraceae bacterium]|jgi:cardiolipin synthase
MNKPKLVIGRIVVTVLLIILELLWILALFDRLQPYIGGIEAVMRAVSVVIVICMISMSRHYSYNIMWIVIILAFPLAGTVVFLFLEVMDRVSSKTYKNIVSETEKSQKYLEQDADVLDAARADAPDIAGQFTYISESSGFPFYENTGFDYYGFGEEGWPVMLEEMKKAEKFIFLEYFIIAPGKMWEPMLEILQEKAQEGVLCRVLYDDMGSINKLPYDYARQLEEMGIHAVAFNRISPVLNGIMNHRDHRKILVIDGKVAFSGGINLSDEYINVNSPFGIWKDNCIRVTGKAVWSYTVLFLTNWNALRHEDDDYRIYEAQDVRPGSPDGWIAPYGETPLDDRLLGQDIYINILNQARNYCYIFSPYLLIDNEMLNALILAAQRGVDVRIILPGIPDKKIVWNIAKTYFYNLAHNGVKIYLYTPGFDHAKVFVSDDRVATVGTLNLDYRSLYLHFENGTYLYKAKEILKIRDDFLEAAEQSHEIRMGESRLHPLRAFFYMALRILTPMM